MRIKYRLAVYAMMVVLATSVTGCAAAKDACLMKEANAAEETQVVEEMQVVEETQAAEESQTTEEKQVSNEKQIAEETQIVEEMQVAEETQVVEETQIAEEMQVEEEKQATEEAQVVEEKQVVKEMHEDKRQDSPGWIEAIGEEKEATQLLVVAATGQTTADVSMHEKDEEGKWKEILSTAGYIGKKGLGKTVEGDEKTPQGTFHFNAAFGIAKDPGCAIPYHQVTNDDYWSGDPREGYAYNQLVSIKDYPDLDVKNVNTEHIINAKSEYQYCLNISYNEECVPGVGGAIFLHCTGKKKHTGGCVAIPKNDMVKVMKNVKEDCVVVIDSLETLSK